MREFEIVSDKRTKRPPEKICGAKKRNGEICEAYRLKGKTRCRIHGGKSTGPVGHKNALKDGIYSEGLNENEKEIWFEISVDSLDDEIRLLKIQLSRANKALKNIEDSPRGIYGEELEENQVAFELDELSEESGSGPLGATDKKTIRRKRPDYRAIIDRLTGRIGKLTLQRAQIKSGDISGDEVTIHVRRRKPEEE
ncbi:MAG: HGGxSTG domain-containing protein [bacterium]|nr:HGGxSTG domain-containing protein [bacterium]